MAARKLHDKVLDIENDARAKFQLHGAFLNRTKKEFDKLSSGFPKVEEMMREALEKCSSETKRRLAYVEDGLGRYSTKVESPTQLWK